MMIASSAMDDPRIMYPNPNPSLRTLREGDIVLTEIAAVYLGYSAKLGHPVSVGPPTPAMQAFHRDVTVPGFSEVRDALGPGVDLDAVQDVADAFRRAGAQSRPMVLHGIDMITSGPKVMVHGVAAGDVDRTLVPGMVMNVEATPISGDGTFGSFLSRSYAITADGIEDLTPHPVDEIVVAG